MVYTASGEVSCSTRLRLGLTGPYPGSRPPRAGVPFPWHGCTLMPWIAHDAIFSTAGSDRYRSARRDSRSGPSSRNCAGKPWHATRRTHGAAARLLKNVVRPGVVDTDLCLGRIQSAGLGEVRGFRARFRPTPGFSSRWPLSGRALRGQPVVRTPASTS